MLALTHALRVLTVDRVRWEWFTSLKFDWEHFSGRRPFRWPLVSSELYHGDSADTQHRSSIS